MVHQPHLKKIPDANGFTLIEALIAVALFIIIVTPLYMAYAKIIEIIQKNQTKAYAIALIQNQIETIRNIPYDEVGVVGSFPPGPIPPTQTIQYRGSSFSIQTTIRNIDDPSDGVTPQDTAPADYKLIEVSAFCTTCANAVPLKITTTTAPKALEASGNTGSLFVNVFDASGNAISGVNVQVINNALAPPISITDTTGLNGMFQLVGIPTSTASYAISISKPGYSSDATYPLGAPGNPNPIKPHATVAESQLTQVSFAIDKVSTLDIQTKDDFCAVVPAVPFSITGTKLLGSDPNVLKYTSNAQTDSNGFSKINNLEWDTYSFSVGGGGYDLAGNTPLMPFIVNPSSTYDMRWMILPSATPSILITVQNASGTLIDNATVNIQNANVDRTVQTGRRSVTKQDWRASNYTSQSGSIDAESSSTMQLLQENGAYSTTTEEWLISHTIDFGTTNTTFYTLSWIPENQPWQTGPNSLRFQIAANNDNALWNFIGPDGTANTFFSTSGNSVNGLFGSNRYMRYKVYMKTEDSAQTPSLESITISFSSSCIPSGQTLISALPTGAYTLTVTAPGYQAYTDSALTISNGWQSYQVTIAP